MVLQVFPFRVEKIKYALVFLRNGMHQNLTPHDINLLNSFGYGVSGLEKALDDSQIFYSLTEKPSIKENLSPEFYFLVLLSKYMNEYSIADKVPMFYVGNLLTYFIKEERLNKSLIDTVNYAVACASSNERDVAFYSFEYAGKLALFLSGIFYKNIENKYNRKILGPQDYISLGVASFSNAVKLKSESPRGIRFLANAENFRITKKVLNKIADYHMGFDDEITRIWNRLVA